MAVQWLLRILQLFCTFVGGSEGGRGEGGENDVSWGVCFMGAACLLQSFYVSHKSIDGHKEGGAATFHVQ